MEHNAERLIQVNKSLISAFGILRFSIFIVEWNSVISDDYIHTNPQCQRAKKSLDLQLQPGAAWSVTPEMKAGLK